MADDDEYEKAKRQIIFGTGYGRPPEHTRFKKGRSGNPAGRPRKKSSAVSDLTLAQQPTLAAAHRAADKMISVREGDQVRDVSAREGVIQAMTVAALKGNSRAAALVLGRFEAAERVHASAIEARKTFWSDYKKEMSAELTKAKQEGKPTPSILPHPDDIIIDDETGAKCIGPINEEDQARVDNTIAYRETLIMRNVLDERSTKRLDGEPLNEPGSAILLAMALDNTLPPRLRFSQWDWIRHQEKYNRVPKRELLKVLFKKWRKVGSPRPRGYVSPDRSETIAQLKFCYSLWNAMQSGSIDPDNQTKAQVEDEIVDLMEQNGIAAIMPAPTAY